MNYEQLGADQRQPATGIIGIFTDTDFDRAYKALDRAMWTNPEYNEIKTMAGPETVLRDIVTFLKERNIRFTPSSAQTVQLALMAKHPQRYTRVDWLDVYLSNFQRLINDGIIPESISNPAAYVPPPASDIPGAIRSAGIGIGVFLIAGVAVYAFFSKGLPATVNR